MIKECLEIFSYNLNQRGERYVLDNYVPKEGTYVLIQMSDPEWGVKESVDIRYNKKTGELEGKTNSDYEFICFLDYYSKLIAMNKPIDPQKIIHSNNYLSFAIKKESLGTGKYTPEVLDLYYEILKDPMKKYAKPNIRKLYEETAKTCGEIDVELLDKIHQWVKNHLSEIEVDTNKKDYLKLFFVFPDEEKTKEVYQREGSRYIIPNIYNNNDYNCFVDDEIYGLPNDNMGLNSKKPYLANKTRKTQVPYLLNREQVLLQAKFYDFLYGQASKGCCNIYFDEDKKVISALKSGERPEVGMSGYFIRLKKGMEAEIHNVDTVLRYNPNLQPSFIYKQMLETNQSDNYGPVNKRKDLERLVDDVLFGKSLIPNYFTDVGDITIKDGTLLRNLLIIREPLNTWFYKNDGINPFPVIEQCSESIIKNTIQKGHMRKACHQLNLKWSLEDYFHGNKRREDTMNQVVENLRGHIREKEDWEFADSKEYYFAVGQMVSYFISKSKAAKKPLSFVNSFINAKDNTMIKKHLSLLFKKYNYDIEYKDIRVKRLYSNIMMYNTDEKVDIDMISAGVTANNLIFEKTKEEG